MTFQNKELEFLARTNTADNPISKRHLIVQCAADITPEPVEWLWPGRVAIGKQTLLAGEVGLGKSQATINIAAAVTTGGLWPCGEGRAPLGNVIILSAEDGAADTVIPRLMAAGADRERVRLISAVASEDGKGRRAFNLQGDLDLLEAEIARIGDVKLVIIDPISSYLGAKIDSHVNAAVRAVLEPVGEMAERLRVAILGVTHPPKGSTTTAINRFIGSIAFVAAARAAFMVTKDADNEDRRLFLPVKNNLAPLGKGLAFWLEQRIVGDPGKGVIGSAVRWESEPVTITADQALAATDGGVQQHGALREAKEFLRETLAQPAGVAAKEAAEAAQAQGIASRTLRRARKELGVLAEKSGMEGGWAWRLPAEEGQHPPKGSNKLNGPLRENVAPFEEPAEKLVVNGNSASPEPDAPVAQKPQPKNAVDDFGPIPVPKHRCNHCGSATGLTKWWKWPGWPDGIWLHGRCEEGWHDQMTGRADNEGDGFDSSKT